MEIKRIVKNNVYFQIQLIITITNIIIIIYKIDNVVSNICVEIEADNDIYKDMQPI